MKANKLSLLALAALLAVSCSTDVVDETLTDSTTAQPAPAPTDTTEHHARLIMANTPIPFDVTAQTRSDAWEWKDGAVIYLQYHVGTNLVRGHAVYSKSANSWDCYYNGQLATAGQCEVYFFDGVNTSDKRNVTLSGSEAVYTDANAGYTVSGSDIVLEAALTPATSRVRFKGSSGLSISVGGITTLTGYNAETNALNTSTANRSLTVASTGFTPYVYATFTNATKRELSITNSKDGDEPVFTKAFGSNVLQKGHSGYITIPTEDTNKGWTVKTREKELEFTVPGAELTVSFMMIRVEPGTFQMGSNDGESDDKPVHSVTLTKAYYMGQTEVTQALWQAVMGQKPTSGGSQWSSQYGLGNDYPAYYISYTDCQEFITKLNAMTGQKFRMPTEAEWEFAAKGGTKTKGYTYAGSNTVGDVAWYTDNSGSQTHLVGEKQDNELGLYDMSGNVREWCADWFGSYTSEVQTDPTGPTTGSHRVIRGGGWGFDATNCRPAHRGYNTPGSRGYNLGFRLAL